MEFGVFHQFPSLPGRSDADTFAEAFGQIDAAEELGLDVIWLSELHFDPQRSVLSAPLSIASAIAARTRRIKIGTAVRCAIHCGWPKRAPRSTRSAAVGSFWASVAVGCRAPIKIMACPTPKAATALPKCSRSSSRPGRNPPSITMANTTAFTTSR